MLDVYVIYKKPSDYPNGYVVKLWRGMNPQKVPHFIGISLMSARASIPFGLTQIVRDNDDVQEIVESWL